MAVQFNKATKKIGDRILFKNMNGTIAPGAKLAVLGQMEAAKPLCSTCFSQTSVACSYRKVVKLILRTNIIYFKTDKTILENVLEETNYTEAFVRTILARLLFRREDVHKPVHVLSGVNE